VTNLLLLLLVAVLAVVLVTDPGLIEDFVTGLLTFARNLVDS
jgi:hypothetical protein